MADKKPTKEEIARRQKKTVSVRKMAEQISGLRRKVSQDMKSDDEKVRLTALVVAIMDKTAERVGNDASAKDGHVGVTGFKNSQVTVSGKKVTLKYTGKSGVEHDKSFTDERIAKVLKECGKRCQKPNDFMMVTSDGFKIKAAQVNNYLKEYGVTAKDIRGYAANHMVIEALKARTKSSDEAERKKAMSEVLQMVAERVGHGKGTLRTHYLLPNIEDDYVKRGKIPSVKESSLRLAAERVAGFFYTGNIVKRVARTAAEKMAFAMVDEIRPQVEEIHAELFGGGPGMIPEMVMVEITDDLKEGKIGSYVYDGDEQYYGLLRLREKAFTPNPQYGYWVIAHELIHAALGEEVSDNHGEEFQMMADAMGMPKDLQD